MLVSNAYQIRTDRSLVDLAYRVVDAGAITAGAVVAAKWGSDRPWPDLAIIAAATLLVHQVACEVSGLYRNWRGARATHELWCVLVNWLVTAPAVLGIGLLTQYNAELSYTAKLLWLVVTPWLICCDRIMMRLALRSLRRRGFNTRRFAICGVNKLATTLAANIQDSPELGLDFVGYYDDRPSKRTRETIDEDRPRAGTLAELIEMARDGRVDMIFITFPMRAEDRIRKILDRLSDATASVYIVPDFFVFQLLHARWTQINGLPAVSVFETPISGIDGVLKRGFDLTVASLALTALAAPMAMVAAAVKLSSPGPVFFPSEAVRHRRRGNPGLEVPQHESLRERRRGSASDEVRRSDHAGRPRSAADFVG